MLSEAEKKNIYAAGRVVSARPLITLISFSPDLKGFDSFFLDAPEMFGAGPALHLLQLQWTTEDGGAADFARKVSALQTRFPGHLFVVLAGTGSEAFALSQFGVAAQVANGSIFVDERVWRADVGKVHGIGMFDATYCARLDPFKRHELAAGIDSLLLTYAHALTLPQAEAYERARALLPRAFFAHHQMPPGTLVNPELICRLNGHARTGICLSAVEGYMRASIEYLLCGLPVVSTPSIGGRDRYYSAPYCRIVDENPVAVAKGVRELAARNFDRQKIRHHVAQKLMFDRYNFLMDLNRIVKMRFGKEKILPSFTPLVGSMVRFSPLPSVIKAMRETYAGLPDD